jgi:hypothetical protein
MKTSLHIVATVCLVMLIACGSTPQSLIVGKWEVENSPAKMTAEFNSDGTAAVTIMGRRMQGTYHFNGPDELEWSMNGMSTKARLKVSESELELTDSANRTIKYKRK